MAKHEISLYENKGATKTKAPYIGSYITKQTYTLDEAITAYGKESGLASIKLKALIDNDIEALTELEKEGACRIHLDGGYIVIRALGSFESSDSEWKSDENRLVIVFVSDDEVAKALVNETPAIVTEDESTKVRVDNVYDIATPKPTEVIHGALPFMVQGINLVTTDEGAKVVLVDYNGVEYPVTVVEVVNRQNIKCSATNALTAGDYRLIVYSRGGDAEGDMQSSFRRVKYIAPAVEPPTVTHCGSADHPNENLVEYSSAAQVTGTKFTSATFRIDYTEDGETKSKTIDESLLIRDSDTAVAIDWDALAAVADGTDHKLVAIAGGVESTPLAFTIAEE